MADSDPAAEEQETRNKAAAVLAAIAAAETLRRPGRVSVVGTPARQLAAAVALIALGAVLMLAAAGREWIPAAEPGPLPSQAAGRSGADLLPWLPAAGWVALAVPAPWSPCAPGRGACWAGRWR